MNNEYQRIAMEVFANQVQMTANEISAAYCAPHVVWKVIPIPDGDMWSCLLGSNLAEGIAGFGSTPAAAAADFDTAWHAAQTPAAALAKHEQTR